ncbi:MAG: hypothetical protein JSU63_12080 [Phycisphaerales bacterium]|nr:MAG: hypothetical protein JSU63_12080 [Phycisphaerales bacterium]
METNEGDQYIPLVEVEQRISEIEDQLVKLPIELEMLERLRAGAVLLDIPERKNHGQRDQSSAAGTKSVTLGPCATTTEKIILYLRVNPRSTPPEVAEAIEDEVESKAKNKRRMLLSSMYNMTRAGRLNADDQGRLTVARNGKEVGK